MKIELRLSSKHERHKEKIKEYFKKKYKNSYIELVEIYTTSDYLDELVVYEYEFATKHNLELVYKIYLKEILSSL